MAKLSVLPARKPQRSLEIETESASIICSIRLKLKSLDIKLIYLHLMMDDTLKSGQLVSISMRAMTL